MTRRIRTSLLSFAAIALPLAAFAQAKPPAPTSAEATKALLTRTHIGICTKEDAPVFSSVKVAPAIAYKPLFGSQETRWLLPVKVEYTVHCTQGNRNMHYGPVTEWQVEVQGDFRMYRDAYGDLQVANDFDDDWSWDDQHWDNPRADVRCRSKRLAMVSYDPAGAVTKREPTPETKAYGDCNVRLAVTK